MPEISRFFGIVVAMYYSEHDPPHFHARYGSERARFAIEDLSMIDGDLGARARGLVVERASLHQDELRSGVGTCGRSEAFVPDRAVGVGA